MTILSLDENSHIWPLVLEPKQCYTRGKMTILSLDKNYHIWPLVFELKQCYARGKMTILSRDENRISAEFSLSVFNFEQYSYTFTP